jgi:hypothetical protein
MDQESISQVNIPVPIFSHNSAHRERCFGQGYGNQEFPRLHTVQNRLCRALNIAQQVATLSNYRFAGNQWRRRGSYRISTAFMKAVAGIEQSDNRAGIQ